MIFIAIGVILLIGLVIYLNPLRKDLDSLSRMNDESNDSEGFWY